MAENHFLTEKMFYNHIRKVFNGKILEDEISKNKP